MEHRGIKPGDHVEAILTKRRLTNDPTPWADESWIDTHLYGKAVQEQSTSPCKECHGWGSVPGTVAGLHDSKVPRKPCQPCKGKGFLPDGGSERLVLKYEVEFENIVNGKQVGEPKLLSVSLPLESFASLRKIKAEEVKEKRVEAYEIGKDGKRQAIGTRRKEWILAQRKLESSGKGNQAGDWRSHVTVQTVQTDLASGILDRHLDDKFIGSVKRAQVVRTGRVG